MSYLLWLVPISLAMGMVGLGAFLWSLRNGQYDDVDGAAERVLLAAAEDVPLAAEEIQAGAKKSKRSEAKEPEAAPACSESITGGFHHAARR